MKKNNITTNTSINEAEYGEILKQAVAQIHTARTAIAKQLSFDLKNEFPDMGLSPRNLWDMKRFYERYYQADIKLRQAIAVYF